MKSTFLLIYIIHHCCMLTSVSGQGVDDLPPPPPPPPIPASVSEDIPSTKDTADIQSASNHTAIPQNETAVVPDLPENFQENGTTVGEDNTTTIDLAKDQADTQNATTTINGITENDTLSSSTMTNITESDPTLDQTNATATANANASQALSDILNEIEMSKNESLVQSVGLKDSTTDLTNGTASNDTSIDTTGIEIAMNQTAAVEKSPVSATKGFRVDLPPPPPIIGVQTEDTLPISETVNKTADVVDTNTTEIYTHNDTIAETAAEGNATIDVSTTQASTNMSDIAVPPSIKDMSEASIQNTISDESALVKKTDASDSAPALPPPIIVPDMSQIQSNKENEQRSNLISDRKTEDSSKSIVTARPPPPPIIFKKDIVPTSWIDPRLKQTTATSLIPATNQMKQIPSEMDPKYMSVSELAYYTLQEMKRQKKEREMKSKGMGVQVFFNTLQPIEKETTQKTASVTKSSSDVGSFDNGIIQTTVKNLKHNMDKLIQTTQTPVDSVKPIPSPPTSERQFYGADFLLAKLGINIPKTTQTPTTTKAPMVTKAPRKIPPGLFKPFLPIIHDTRLSPPLKPATRAPFMSQRKPQNPTTQKPETPSQMFFDSNYLLKQLGLNVKPIQTTRVPTTRSPLFWQQTRGPRTPTTTSPQFWQQRPTTRVPTNRSPLFWQQTQASKTPINKSPPFWQLRPTTRVPTTRSPIFWHQTQKPVSLTTRAPVFRPRLNQQFMHVRTQTPIQTTPTPNDIQRFNQQNLGMRQNLNTFGDTLRQNIFNRVQFQNEQGIKNQKFGLFHTRPIDLTKPKPHDITDHSINLTGQKLTANTKNTFVNQFNVPTTPVPLTNFNIPRQTPEGGFKPFIFGSAPVRRDSLNRQNNQATANIRSGTSLREKFNQRLKQTKDRDSEQLWKSNIDNSALVGAQSPTKRDLHIASNAFDATKPIQESNFNSHQIRNFNTFNIGDNMMNIGRRIQSVPQEVDTPIQGLEIRRNINNPSNINMFQQKLPSGLQQLQNSNLNNLNLNNLDFYPQFALAAQHGESQISHSRTLDLQTPPITIEAVKTDIRQTPSKDKRGTQTHWSAQLPNSWQNNAAHVPYRIDQARVKATVKTTASPLRFISDTTIKPINFERTYSYTVPKLQNIPEQTTVTATTTATTLPTTTTTTTTTTTLPTVPPTADPQPPPIFDTRILQTFMPMPKPGDTTPPTDFGEAGGNGTATSDTEGSCKGCVFVNDRCLLPHPKHCSMYIECVRQNKQVRSFTRECALGAFFDRKSYLCVDPRVADCPTDRCRESGLKWYPIEGHCKHYWSCGVREGGAAFAQSECCPDMGGFLDGKGCVENPNCTESCDQAINRNTPTGCKLKKTATPTVYYDENAKMERPCAPGTLFNELQCTCVQDVTLERRENRTGGEHCSCTNDTTCACRGQLQAATGEPTCPASLILNFDKDPVADSSSTKQHIGVDGVATTKAGEGLFNGGSKLVLWRYANLMIPLVFAVRLKFLATATEPRYQTLLSNCDKTGALEPTFDLSIDTLYGEVVFSIDTYDGQAKKFKIMYEPNVWTSLDVIYDGERIVGSVNGRPRNIIAAGGIETRPFPLSIGGCGTIKGFKGLMENVYIYEKCIPDEMYGVFMAVLE